MNIKIKCLSIAFILHLTIILSAGNLFAGIINLNLKEFTSFPEENVIISNDGLSATLYEDDYFAPVSLENDIDIPSDAVSLSFDYELNVPSYNVDYFDFYIGDLSMPAFSKGGGEGVYPGEYIYGDLAGLRNQTVTVKIIFDLMYDPWKDWGYDSWVTVSNVNINTVPQTVPEPGACLLLGSLLIGMIGLDVKRNWLIKVYKAYKKIFHKAFCLLLFSLLFLSFISPVCAETDITEFITVNCTRLF